MVLGDAVTKLPGGEGPQCIAPSEKGVGYLVSDSERVPRKFKGWYVSDSEVQKVDSYFQRLREAADKAVEQMAAEQDAVRLQQPAENQAQAEQQFTQLVADVQSDEM